NAILIVEFAKLEHEKGKNTVEAALAGAWLRLRPILMTSFAFILGCVPLWTAQGSGAVGRRILGTVVIGGMSAASLIAIFLIPVTFAVVEGVSFRVGRHREPVTQGGRSTYDALGKGLINFARSPPAGCLHGRAELRTAQDGDSWGFSGYP